MVESGPLSAPGFAAFAAAHVPLLHVTTLLPDRPHDDLHERIGGRGFPHIALLDADGTVLAVDPGEPEWSLEGFARAAEVAAANRAFRRRSEAGDPEAARALFLAQVGMAALAPDEARRRAAGLALSPDERARVDGYIVDAEIFDLLRWRLAPAGPETHAALARRCAEWFAAGCRALDPMTDRAFLMRVLDDARARADAALFGRAFDAIRAGAKDEPRHANWLAGLAAEHGRMRAAGGG